MPDPIAGRQTSRLNPNANAHPRRNLFAGGALRRPASSSAPTTATTSTTRLDSPPNDESDIVIRRRDGTYTAMAPNISPTDGEMTTTEEEEESEARLMELLKNRRKSTEPELLELLSTSLQQKVNSLDTDKWIFEPEKPRS